MLAIDHVTQRFSGLVALNNVTLSVTEGAIHGIIGPNGAGKSTLFNVVSGVYKPTGGSVQFLGQEVTGLEPWQIVTRGMSRTFQNIRLFADMNILENVMVGRYARTNSGAMALYFAPGRELSERRETTRRAEELLNWVGAYSYRLARPRELPYGIQRRVEIARALASNPRLLLLDEPTAGMTKEESADLMELIHKIRTDGRTVCLIEHNMRVIMNVSDRITVLNFGEKIAEGLPAEIRENPEVVRAYLGSEATWNA